MRWSWVSWAVLAALLTAPVGFEAAEAGFVKKKIRKEERDKRDVDRQIRNERRRLKKLENKDKSILGQIIRDNRKVNAAKNNERVSQRNLNKVRSRLGEIRGEVAGSWERVQRRQQALGKRLAAIYRQGPMEPLTLLVGATDSSEFLSRYRLLRQLAERDRGMIEETYAELEQISIYEKEFQGKEKELEKQASQVRQAKKKLLAAKRERERRLYAIRKEKKQKEKLVSELRAQSKKMQALLGQLRADYQRQKTGMPAKHPKRNGGRLGYIAWPMRGRLVSKFGPHKHPVYDTTVFNKGLEIGGRLGNQVLSAQDGTVIFADVFEGYGQMVILDHGSGYWTLYGHLSGLEVSVGQRLARGQKIGELGLGGISSVPTLYFEVRQKAKPVNPLRYLRP